MGGEGEVEGGAGARSELGAEGRQLFASPGGFLRCSRGESGLFVHQAAH